ncbi:MAG: hypothetical protein HW402_1281 [Dehalococcoidales bacterium]|nr:hypothetical protein [Dehalococcoidales bacterium]
MVLRRPKIVLLTIIGIIALVLAGYSPIKVQADTNPVDLKLGGEGTTGWNITSIKPGDSGTKTVDLLNAGRLDGFVTIWVSNLVSIGTTGSSKITDYLLLSVSGQGLGSNLSFPVTMTTFPQSSSGSDYVRVNPLGAGETTTLVWKWELPYQTGNDVQGKGISFTINYLLEGIPPGLVEPEVKTPPVPPQELQFALEGKTNGIKVDTGGTVQETVTLTAAAGDFVIDINKGTRITGPDGMVLERVELGAVGEATEQPRIEELVDVPKNTVALSPVYEITGYRDGMKVSHVNFDPYIVITINYDPGNLPENALPPFIVNFSQGGSLMRLEPPPDALFELGKAKGVAYHASYFAVMTEVAPPPPPLPAHFKVSNLAINPAQARLGQSVSISVDIANDGAVTGSYELYLVIDGIVRAVKGITVEPQSIVTLRFEISNLAAGEHQIKVSGLTGKFRVTNMVIEPAESQVNWLLIDLGVAAIAVLGLLVTYLVVRRSQQRYLR